LATRFPAIIDAALRIKAESFLIDGEAVIARDVGTPDFYVQCSWLLQRLE
jgi:ATP-dependent DNA ligase